MPKGEFDFQCAAQKGDTMTIGNAKANGHDGRTGYSRVLIGAWVIVLAAHAPSAAATLCFSSPGSYGGITVTEAGSGCGTFLDYGTIAGVYLGDTNVDESCTFDISPPVAGTTARVRFTAHSCPSQGCEKVRFRVNGLDYNVQPADIDDNVPPDGDEPIVLLGSGEIRGASDNSGDGRATVTFNGGPAAMTSIEIAHDIMAGFPNGTVYEVCVDATLEVCDNDIDDDGDNDIDEDDVDCHTGPFDDGELLRGVSGSVYYVIYGDAKFAINDQATFDAMGLDSSEVDLAPDFIIAALPAVPDDDVVLQEFSGTTVWAVSGGLRTQVASIEELEALGIEPEDIGVVPDGGLDQIPMAPAGARAASSTPSWKHPCSGYRGGNHPKACRFVGNCHNNQSCGNTCLRPVNNRSICRRIVGTISRGVPCNPDRHPCYVGDDGDMTFDLNPINTDSRQYTWLFAQGDRSVEETPLVPDGELRCRPERWREMRDANCPVCDEAAIGWKGNLEDSVDEYCSIHVEVIRANHDQCKKECEDTDNGDCPKGCDVGGLAYKGRRGAFVRKINRRVGTNHQVGVAGALMTEQKSGHIDCRNRDHDTHKAGWVEIHPAWKIWFPRAPLVRPLQHQESSCDVTCCDGSGQSMMARTEESCEEGAADQCHLGAVPGVKKVKFREKRITYRCTRKGPSISSTCAELCTPISGECDPRFN